MYGNRDINISDIRRIEALLGDLHKNIEAAILYGKISETAYLDLKRLLYHIENDIVEFKKETDLVFLDKLSFKDKLKILFNIGE